MRWSIAAIVLAALAWVPVSSSGGCDQTLYAIGSGMVRVSITGAPDFNCSVTKSHSANCASFSTNPQTFTAFASSATCEFACLCSSGAASTFISLSSVNGLPVELLELEID